MPREMGLRAQIALLLFTTLNVAVFTVAVYIVMLSPTLNEHAGFWLTLTMAASVLITAPLAWCAASCCPVGLRKKIVAERSPLSDAPSRTF